MNAGFSSSKETHQLAQANDEKNRRLREAFGIGEFNQKEIAKQKLEAIKEAEKRKAELASREYTWGEHSSDRSGKTISLV